MSKYQKVLTIAAATALLAGALPGAAEAAVECGGRRRLHDGAQDPRTGRRLPAAGCRQLCRDLDPHLRRANYFFKKHDIKVQTTYRMNADYEGVEDLDVDEIFVQAQYVF